MRNRLKPSHQFQIDPHEFQIDPQLLQMETNVAAPTPTVATSDRISRAAGMNSLPDLRATQALRRIGFKEERMVVNAEWATRRAPPTFIDVPMKCLQLSRSSTKGQVREDPLQSCQSSDPCQA